MPVHPLLDDLAGVIGATTPAQDKAPTPCGDLDVISLRRPSPAASEPAHALLSDAIQPEFRGGAGMPFAPEVPVNADAVALDRLLGFAGRSPQWTPNG